jgi:hypothetical protein
MLKLMIAIAGAGMAFHGHAAPCYREVAGKRTVVPCAASVAAPQPQAYPAAVPVVKVRPGPPVLTVGKCSSKFCEDERARMQAEAARRSK